ncbi:hypothetical protein [Salinimonas lutimaris]|uniref:hypothetical protein n=1 Tax=Salinimonas lutimaris TaxID=914153 RepID=UPI0010C13385|nr:hypothetical protein [Salinimonas lutimaris]
MCGYCIENEALSVLIKGQFNSRKVAELAENHFNQSLTAIHVLPEFAGPDPNELKHFSALSPNEPVALWISLRQILFNGSVTRSKLTASVQAAMQDGILLREKERFASFFIASLPAFTQLLSATSPEQLISDYHALTATLIAEAKIIIREASGDFLRPFFIKSADASFFPNMPSPSYTEEEHPAFEELPFTLLLAADILINHTPDTLELTAAALHTYPTPGFGSVMTAWQRHIAWHWYAHNGKDKIKTLGTTMRRELLLYLAMRLKAHHHPTDWFPAVAASMTSPIVDMNNREILKVWNEGS